ncbi:MAG: DUF1080 domain-containing protein [Candidatus Hydrogenedens sp.]|jgi:hypothetical protein|nr:DUF1080 domain-containing protein [Candidatus Hydrogenedens sp.]
MRLGTLPLFLILLTLFLSGTTQGEENGFISLFDGKSLEGWEGKEGAWYIEDGALTAESTADKPCPEAHYLYWKDGEPGNFILRCSYKIAGDGGNSGVHFRSEERPDWDIWGYQADIEKGFEWTGCLFQHDRGGVVMRGFKAHIDSTGKKKEQVLGDPALLLESVHQDDWNDYEIIAEDATIRLIINGTTMCEVEDHDPVYSRRKGHIALQMHPGPPMKIQFKNIRLKILD